MSFNAKALLVALVLFVAVPLGAIKYYRYTHPVFIPLPPREEITLTIIPGWDLRDIADYLVKKGVASSTADVYAITGQPGKLRNRFDQSLGPSADFVEQKPREVSLEGYLAPETVRVFVGAPLDEGVIDKFIFLREKELKDAASDIAAFGKTPHEILTMASIIEKEARTGADRKMVADIMWRRVKIGMALQVDSSVHYAVDKTGTVFTTDKERDVKSPWNTYKYPGLPPGPIGMPSVESIQAALHPEKNAYLYFLSGTDGTMHYAQTLDEHNANRYKYIR